MNYKQMVSNSPVAISCEHSTERLGSKKVGNFLTRDCRLQGFCPTELVPFIRAFEVLVNSVLLNKFVLKNKIHGTRYFHKINN
jgi:hypothetical protein